jgi:hypothetical protein
MIGTINLEMMRFVLPVEENPAVITIMTDQLSLAGRNLTIKKCKKQVWVPGICTQWH